MHDLIVRVYVDAELIHGPTPPATHSPKMILIMTWEHLSELMNAPAKKPVDVTRLLWTTNDLLLYKID